MWCLQRIFILFAMIQLYLCKSSATLDELTSISSLYQKAASEIAQLENDLENDQERSIENLDVISLNVGGQIIMTTRQTLTRISQSTLALMFKDQWQSRLPTDRNGNIFLDYNPIVFRHLLDQLQLSDTKEFYPPLESSLVEPFKKMLRKLGLYEFINLSEKNTVRINMGGQIFTHQRTTFTQMSNATFHMTALPFQRIDSDIFIDSDPKLLQHLIEQLREVTIRNPSYLKIPSSKETSSFKKMLSDLNVNRNSILLCVGITNAANWALLVAGSNGWFNYRHQADVCHAYQILHNNGIPDSNIVVMMFDDLAQSSANPTKGIIINHPHGHDVYHGVPKDYTGATVTPENFINILLGNKTAMQGIGSGKVIESGPDDNVFVYFTDHGAIGLVAFPSSVLYATDLNTTIAKMYTAKKYKQMVIYIEACESGSMLENILPNNINVYATTASNAEESSYACYLDNKRATYLGDCYSVAWMENSDEKKSSKETLYDQYLITKRKTHESHVMQYGDLELGKSHNIDEFQGNKTQSSKESILLNHYNSWLKRDAVLMENVRISILSHRVATSKENSIERQQLEKQLAQTLHDKQIIENHLEQIVLLSLSINSIHSFEEMTQKRMKLTQHICYKSVTQHVHKKCFDLQNEFVLHKLWTIANLCEIGLKDFTIKHAIDQACPNRLHFDY
ncbi:hypothetical protein I4U23_020277 [Adineta vaga]|nr:hypothetical protein I4U23_020277 [Adineta vaga]